MKSEMLRLDRVTQIEEGETLLGGINLHIFRGEVMGLICVNSSGLEALILLLGQNVPIHYGYVYFEERLVNSYRHSSMLSNQVTMIEKRSCLVQNLSVADNIFVLRYGFKKYLIDSKVLEQQFAILVEDLNISIDSGKLVCDLSAYEKCVVELLRAIVAGIKLVILRDIGSFIGTENLHEFHSFVRRYAALGISFLYISSHHEEVFPICDRIALMANGKILKMLDKDNFDQNTLERFTVPGVSGRSSNSFRPNALSPAPSETILEFRHVETENLYDFSLKIGKGECVVLIDSDYTTLSDLASLMRGQIAPQHGRILVGGLKKNRKSIQRDVCVIVENPIQYMLFPKMSYIDNLCFLLNSRTPLLWWDQRIRSSILQEYEPLIGADIHTKDISTLSAVSLYRLIYYRIHLYHPKVVFCVQPFAGADIYLSYHLAGLIGELQAHGIAVVILAVNLSDSLAAADRQLSIVNGRLVADR